MAVKTSDRVHASDCILLTKFGLWCKNVAGETLSVVPWIKFNPKYYKQSDSTHIKSMATRLYKLHVSAKYQPRVVRVKTKEFSLDNTSLADK